MNLVEVHHATLRYRGMKHPALNKVSLSVSKGETIGVVGESGSGKSSLARCMLGLEVLSSGTVAFKGQDVASLSRRERSVFRRAVQMVFQDPYNSLNPRMKIGSTLGEALLFHGMAADRKDAIARAAGLMARVGLNELVLDRYPHELSGGQRQRVGIARAIAVEPEVLIADEPVSALDVSVQASILNLLKSLVRETGVALVLIAHDLAVVRLVCDRVIVMHDGVVVEQGAADEVIHHPRDPYTRRLVASVPEL